MSGIHGIVSALQNAPYKEIDKRVQRELGGVADIKTPAGRAVLSFRANFVTELRKQGVWPKC